MKIKLFISICILMSLADVVSAQNLVTKKTYFDWNEAHLHEVFTVIAGTGTRHGSYKEYNQYGELEISANYNKNLLHGVCTIYSGTSPNHITTTTNYVNGKKNGEEKEYSILHDYNLEAKNIYKDGGAIERTIYYTDKQNKNKKKSHTKIVDGKIHGTDWYPNGQIEYDHILQVTPGNYANIETVIQYNKYNEAGLLFEKLEDNVIFFYAKDGKTLERKNNQKTKVEEFYKNGILEKSIRIFEENGNEYREISLFKDNSPYSKTVIDKNGNDIEVLKKEAQLKKQYDSLYSVLETIFPIQTYEEKIKESTYSYSQEFGNPDIPIRKALYESKEKFSDLESVYMTQGIKLSRMASQRAKFSELNPTNKKINIQESIDGINAYIKKCRQQNILQRYDTLYRIKEVIEPIQNDLYYIECLYTYYQGQQGYKDNVPKKHKVAYNAYISVTQYLSSRLENKTLSNTLELVQLYAMVCSKMRKWEKVKISAIEKLLKKVQSPEDQLLIFIKNDIEPKK